MRAQKPPRWAPEMAKSEKSSKMKSLANISPSTPSCPGKLMFIRSICSMGGLMSKNQHSICKQCRQNTCCTAEIGPKSDICRKKRCLAFISRDTAYCPEKVMFVRSAYFTVRLLSRNQHSTCNKCREFACSMPGKWQIARQDSIWCLFLQIQLPDPSSTISFVLFGP